MLFNTKDFVCRVYLLFVVVTISVLTAACEDDSAKSESQRQDWVTDEVLLQLANIQRELKDIKGQVGEIEGKVSQISTAKVAVVRPSAKPRFVAGPDSVQFGSSEIVGSDKAQIAIIEFTDYQCPYCARHTKEVFPRIKSDLIDTGKVKYVVRPYPLDFHPKAKGATVAAICAGEQGKFWDMHDELFKNFRTLSETLYMEKAAALGIDTDDFSACLKSQEHVKAVEKNLAYGGSIGVTGTPKFFIGRVDGESIKDVIVVSGAQSYTKFKATVDKLIN